MKAIQNAGAVRLLSVVEVLICLLAFIGLVSIFQYFGNKPVISPYERENIILQRECDSLKNYVSRLQIETNSYSAAIDSLQHSLNSLTSLQTQNQTKHENEMERIDSMPADSLFHFFTKYLE
jgi:cell shape-determining protein MreC